MATVRSPRMGPLITWALIVLSGIQNPMARRGAVSGQEGRAWREEAMILCIVRELEENSKFFFSLKFSKSFVMSLVLYRKGIISS